MSELGNRLQQGDPEVRPALAAKFGRAVTAWLRAKYPALDATQARQALDRAVARLWDCRDRFDTARDSVSQKLNYYAELAALGQLLKTDFGAVADQLGDTVHRYVVGMLRRLGFSGDVQETAEDVRQQTLLAAWRSIDRFDPTRSVKAWLWKIARNCLLTELRRRQRKPAAMAADLEEPLQFADEDELPAVLRDFCEVLDQIPAHHQELLLLSVVNNRRYGPEAVRHLAFSSPACVRVTRSRLFKKIRGEMRKRGHFADRACPESPAAPNRARSPDP